MSYPKYEETLDYHRAKYAESGEKIARKNENSQELTQIIEFF